MSHYITRAEAKKYTAKMAGDHLKEALFLFQQVSFNMRPLQNE